MPFFRQPDSFEIDSLRVSASQGRQLDPPAASNGTEIVWQNGLQGPLSRHLDPVGKVLVDAKIDEI